jgi:hypothetical protein
MEAPNHDKVLHDAHQSLNQTAMMYSATVNDKREHVDRRQQHTIKHFVYKFLDNIKVSRWSPASQSNPCASFDLSLHAKLTDDRSSDLAKSRLK